MHLTYPIKHTLLFTLISNTHYYSHPPADASLQIGWVDGQFRCDPVCGQGVGDHMHSWAFDGLRTKKWNVSCEGYGRRWRLGDTVGVLLDTDLMEMRFFLNGRYGQGQGLRFMVRVSVREGQG